MLAAYAAGELDPDDQARVHALLERSPHLQGELRRYQRLFRMLQAAATAELTPPSPDEMELPRDRQPVFTNAAKWTGELIGAYGRALAFYFK